LASSWCVRRKEGQVACIGGVEKDQVAMEVFVHEEEDVQRSFLHGKTGLGWLD
jgi:hypothetical protein